MPRPYKPRITNAAGGLIAITYPPERPEPASEPEGTSWRKGNRRKADSDESWYPPPQNVARQKKLTKRKSRTDNKLPETESNSDSDESSVEVRPRKRKSKAKRVQIGGAKNEEIMPILTSKSDCFLETLPMKHSKDAPKSQNAPQLHDKSSGSSSDSLFSVVYVRPARRRLVDTKSIFDESPSEVPPQERTSKSGDGKQETLRYIYKPISTSESKFISSRLSIEESASKGDKTVQLHVKSSVKDSLSESDARMNDDGSSSSSIDIPPTRQTTVESPTLTESDMELINEPLISTYVAPARPTYDESDGVSASEMQHKKGPSTPSYDSLVENPNASSSGSDNEEQIERFEPLISTYYSPAGHTVVVASTSESDSEGNFNNEPLISTYSAPAKQTVVASSSSEFESEVEMSDGPIITTYYPSDRQTMVDSSTESENEKVVCGGPIFSTWVAPSNETESDSESVSGPILSTCKGPGATKHRSVMKSSVIVKPKTGEPRMVSKDRRPTFTNKAVKRLEAGGKAAAIKVPTHKSHIKPKIGKPKQKRIRKPNPTKPKLKLPCNACERVFNKVYNLERHVRDFHNGEPVQCAICGIKFSCQRGWVQHQEIFHNKYRKDVHCNYCGKAFASKNARSMHLLRGCPQNSKPC